MSKHPVYDQEGDVHFVTFSCYKRRRILDDERPARIVVSFLMSQLKRQKGKCLGFVVMPDHVHAAVWFEGSNQLARFMQQWKRRTSIEIKKTLRTVRTKYAMAFDAAEPVWQAHYYDFNVRSEGKLAEKLGYMHGNPVRAGLVERAEDWRWSSARWYELGKSVGVPIGW